MDMQFHKLNVSKIVYRNKALQHPKRQHGFPMAWNCIDQVSVRGSEYNGFTLEARSKRHIQG